MAVGVRVWIGVHKDLDVWDDEYADTDTVASSQLKCKQLIAGRNRLVRDKLVPVERVLILKGRMT